MSVYDISGNVITASVYVSVKDFGAAGNGITDDGPKIRQAITYCQQSGKTLFFPEGIYFIGTGVTSAEVALSVSNTPANIIGSGMGKSIIRLSTAFAGRYMGLSLKDVSMMYIRDITIDNGYPSSAWASETEEAGAHCIRLANCDNIQIENVELCNAKHYGIGMQGNSSRHILINGVYIHDVGGDGIDFKNFDDTNADLTINNTTVINPALTTFSTAQCGIDVRCKGVNINNIFIQVGSGGKSGIRARSSTTLQGTGGKFANINNVTIIGTSGNTGIGISCDTDGVKIQNVHIEKMGQGFYLINKDNGVSDGSQATYSHIENCTLSECFTNAFYIYGDGNTIENTTIENMTGTTAAIQVLKGTSHSFSGCIFKDINKLFEVANSIEKLSVIGCKAISVATLATGNTTAIEKISCIGMSN